MRYSRLGDTGLLVSRLSFDSMTFGQGDGRGAARRSLPLDETLDAFETLVRDGKVRYTGFSELAGVDGSTPDPDDARDSALEQ